jgi:hypothetical protein
LADAQDLGSCGATRGGSNPFARTIDFIGVCEIALLCLVFPLDDRFIAYALLLAFFSFYFIIGIINS